MFGEFLKSIGEERFFNRGVNFFTKIYAYMHTIKSNKLINF